MRVVFTAILTALVFSGWWNVWFLKPAPDVWLFPLVIGSIALIVLVGYYVAADDDWMTK